MIYIKQWPPIFPANGPNQAKYSLRDRHTFLMLYKQYVRPHLEFSSQAWSPWLVGDKLRWRRSGKRQKRVSGLKSKEYKERCLELGLDTLEKRREEQDMVLVHKMAMGGQLGQIFEMTDVNDRPRTRKTEREYRTG